VRSRGSPLLLLLPGLALDCHRDLVLSGERRDPFDGADGVVDYISFDRATGFMICSVHLSSAAVEPRQLVRRGQVLGEVGIFRNSGGVRHVHFQLCRTPSCYSATEDHSKVTARTNELRSGGERRWLPVPALSAGACEYCRAGSSASDVHRFSIFSLT